MSSFCFIIGEFSFTNFFDIEIISERNFEIPRKPRNLYNFSPSDIKFETVKKLVSEF